LPSARQKPTSCFATNAGGISPIFESDQKNVEAAISRDEAIGIASDWAQSFYQDDSLQVADIALSRSGSAS
jgi:hypothetical protein